MGLGTVGTCSKHSDDLNSIPERKIWRETNYILSLCKIGYFPLTELWTELENLKVWARLFKASLA